MNLTKHLPSSQSLKTVIPLFLLVIFCSPLEAQQIELIPVPEEFTLNYAGSPVVYQDKLYLRYRRADFTYVLVEYDGNNLKVIPGPEAYGDSEGNYLGDPIVYRDKLYLRFQKSGSPAALVAFDGNKLEVIDAPTGYIEYQGYPIVFEDRLYLRYFNSTLVAFDGIDFQVYENTGAFQGANRGYVGTPARCGDQLCLSFRGEGPTLFLAHIKDSVLHIVPHPEAYDGGGYQGNPITHNGSIYTTYLTGDDRTDLAVLEKDSLTFITPPDSLGGPSALQNTFFAASFHDQLLLQFKFNGGNFGLVVFQDSSFRAIASPPGFNAPGAGFYESLIVSRDLAYLTFFNNNDQSRVVTYDGGSQLREITLPAGTEEEALNRLGEFYLFDNKVFTSYYRDGIYQLAALEGETLHLFDHPDTSRSQSFGGQMIAYNSELYFGYVDNNRSRLAKLDGLTSRIAYRNISNNLKAYPNPSAGRHINLELKNSLEGPVQLQVFDLHGRLLRKEVLQKAGDLLQIQLDLSGFAAGTYYVQMLQGDRYRAVGKIVLLKDH